MGEAALRPVVRGGKTNILYIVRGVAEIMRETNN
jgi:hypothetical protein